MYSKVKFHILWLIWTFLTQVRPVVVYTVLKYLSTGILVQEESIQTKVKGLIKGTLEHSGAVVL